MFTGLVQHVGRLLASDPTPAGRRLLVDPAGWDHRPAPGDSIAVSGVCLTLVEHAEHQGRPAWTFHAVPETLAKTTLGGLRPGDLVNLEHAVTPTTLLGGHLVQGHVDGLAEVVRVQATSDWRVEFRPPPEMMPWFIPKGSVCLEGVSLTLAEVNVAKGTFEVALIPVTLERTTLRSLRPRQHVNFEADAMVKAVVHVMRHYAGALHTPQG